MKKFTFLMAIAFMMAFSFQSFAQTIEFEDDFESGTANWELTGDWDLTEEYSNSATHSMTDSPGGNYSASQDTYCTMLNGIDLTDAGILSAVVNFWSVYDIENSIDFDWVKVQASTDDFGTFVDLAIFNGEGNLDPWMEYSYSLGAYIGIDNVKVRFHFHSDGGYEVDGIYIDDFKIISSDVDDAPPYIGYSNPPTFYEGTMDDFVFVVDLIDVSGIESTMVNYQVDGGDWMSVDGVNTSGDEYEYTIPAQEPGCLIVFNIDATDASPDNNTITSMDYTYISGVHVFYDDPEVEFYTNILQGDGAAVIFSFSSETQIVTALIRNYEDQSQPPNHDFIFHMWTSDGVVPDQDMITPFAVTPAATTDNPNPMTVIDLRDYTEELTIPVGDVFMGLIEEEELVKLTLAPLVANRSFAFSGGSWGAASGDFHFRLVTNGNTVATDDMASVVTTTIMFPNPTTDILYINSENKILNLNIVNLAGQTVYTESLNVLKTQIEVNRLDAGVYFVNVETVNGISTQKIIVK